MAEGRVKMMNKINCGEVYPIEFEAKYHESSAMGFISPKAAEQLDYDYDACGLHDFIAGTKVVMLDHEGNVLPDETYTPVEKTEKVKKDEKKETKSEKDAKKKYQKDDVQDALVEEVKPKKVKKNSSKTKKSSGGRKSQNDE